MPKLDGTQVRVALVGAGGISRTHVNGFIEHADKIKCVAMVDLSDEAITRRAEQLGQPVKRYSDWRKMLTEMGNEIDAVDICLPHHLHAQAILDSAAAGKHILCEKPMCMTLAEADKIGEAVRSSGILYMSAHNQLFMPVVQHARKMLDDGALGRVFLIRSQDCFLAGGGKVDPFKGTWRSNKTTQGGGVLIDTGYHPTYRLLHLANSKPAAVRGTMGRFRQAIEGEDTASVQVRFENGVMGEITTSWAHANPHGSHQIHIIGENGQIFGSEGDLFFLPAGASEPTKRSFGEVDTFVAQMGCFADCLLTGAAPPHGYDHGRAVLEVIVKASESAQGWQS